MEAARARRDPDLARGHMAVDDHLRAVGVLDLDHTAGLQLHVGVDAAFFQRRFDPLERLLGERGEFGLFHALPC